MSNTTINTPHPLDYLGQQLYKGDKVAYIQSWSSSSSYFLTGTVTGFTKEFVKINNKTRKSKQKVIKIFNQQP